MNVAEKEEHKWIMCQVNTWNSMVGRSYVCMQELLQTVPVVFVRVHLAKQDSWCRTPRLRTWREHGEVKALLSLTVLLISMEEPSLTPRVHL